MKLLIQNTKMLLYENEKFIIKNGSILINQNKIEKIGDIDKQANLEIIDGNQKLAIPGLINTHGHIAMSLFRNYRDDVDLETWLNKYILPREDLLKKGDTYYPSLLSIIEMIRSGITYASDMYFFMEETAKAIEESGMRANLARSVSCGDSLFDKNKDRKLKESIELFEKYNGRADGRIKVSIAPHAVYTCVPRYLEECGNIARRLDSSIQIHLSETKKELINCKKEYGITPFEHCEKLGLFNINKNIIAAHCVYLEDIDYEIIKRHNISISHNPTSNLKLASGVFNIKTALSHNINISLGTDGAGSNNTQNMFNEMRLAGILHKGVNCDSHITDASQILKMATINGGIAQGDSNLGVIKEGAVADIVLLNIDKPHYYPQTDESLVSALVYSANSSDVETVLVNGKIIMENRELKTIDEEKVKYEFQKNLKGLI